MIWELRFLESFHDVLSCVFMDRLMVLLSWLGDGGLVWLLLCFILLIRPQTRRLGLSMALSLAFELVSCSLLKVVIARPRPFTIERDVALLVDPPTDWSFPSGHTASSFAAASALKDAGWKATLPATMLASLIALSRLYLFVHFPSDVVAGLALGLVCGWLGRQCADAILRLSRHGKDRGVA